MKILLYILFTCSSCFWTGGEKSVEAQKKASSKKTVAYKDVNLLNPLFLVNF